MRLKCQVHRWPAGEQTAVKCSERPGRQRLIPAFRRLFRWTGPGLRTGIGGSMQSLEAPICPTCGQPFVLGQHRKKYCSAACYERRAMAQHGVGALGAFLAAQVREQDSNRQSLSVSIGITVSELNYLVRGHHKPDRAIRNKLRATFGSAVPLAPEPTVNCIVCGNPFEPERTDRERLVCSTRCMGRKRLKLPIPKTELARFVFNDWRASDQTMAAYAIRIKVTRSTLGNIIRGSRPTERTYVALYDYFGARLPPLETETERRRERALRNWESALKKARSPEARTKQKAALRGRKQSARALPSAWPTAERSVMPRRRGTSNHTGDVAAPYWRCTCVTIQSQRRKN